MNNQIFGEVRQPITFQLDGVEFNVKPMVGRDALRLSYKLSRAISPSFGVLADGGIKSGGKLLDVQVDIGKAIELFFSQCDEQEFMDIAERLLASAETNRSKVNLESLCFHGKPELIIKLASKIAQYQFAGFFSDWGPKLAARFQDVLAKIGNQAPSTPAQ